RRRRRSACPLWAHSAGAGAGKDRGAPRRRRPRRAPPAFCALDRLRLPTSLLAFVSPAFAQAPARPSSAAASTQTPAGWPAGGTLFIVAGMVNNGTGGPGVAAEEADAYRVLPGRADGGLIVLCDHAGNALPSEFGTLGLPPAQLSRHIAYDIGAAPITQALAAALGVPAVMTRYSRLLIDPNRGVDDPTLIMRLSDGAVIPGNRR